jgi:ergothioneine biosynthesis protein EgtB
MPQGELEPRAVPSWDVDPVQHFRRVRAATEALCRPLEPEDYGLQSMPDASPPKWHLAHTTWFFDTFVLAPRGTPAPFDPAFSVLFNSYYIGVGPAHARPQRGLLSRPTIAEVRRYREQVDAMLVDLLERGAFADRELALVELGLHHEQQHQELLLTDLLHAFSHNPLRPAYRAPIERRDHADAPTLRWVEHPGGLLEVGHGAQGFAFDNELPRHRVHLAPFALGSRLVTCGEVAEFIADGGYRRAELWLAPGWDALQRGGWQAPLYWEHDADDRWRTFTLAGMQAIEPAAPVCHVSYFEADAYARWAGARLPNEHEWEVLGRNSTIAGNFAERGRFQPQPLATAADRGLAQAWGDAWEWTRSAYAPYPGFRPLAGTIGEYNGKFMCGQLVLRGGSCATPATHVRATYRNYFPPEARWQFSGIRLARDA